MDIERNRREALVVARTTLATVQAAATSAAEAVTAAEEHEADALRRVQQAELMLDGVMERPTYDAGVRDLDSVKVDHVLAARKTKAATDERAAAKAKVEKAQKAVEAAVDALLDAEKPARHAQFEQLARQIMPLAETIAAYIPTGIHRQPGFSSGLSPAGQRVLDALMAATDGIHTPAHLLGTNGSNVIHKNALAARRARLIAGQVDLPKQANG